MYGKSRITQTAATVARIMGIPAPYIADNVNEIVTEKASAAFSGGHCDRVLMYNPDAVALWLYQKYTDIFAPVLMRTSLQLPVTSVMPSVTPVCFASMYTGAPPEIHGIRKYEKPVVKTDSLFDALIRAGKRCAIVSDTAASMSHIFLGKAMDYFIFDSVDEITAKAAELIRADAHELIAVYHGNYDSTMHKCAPENKRSLAALAKNSADFAALTDEARAAWTAHNVFIGYLPDHGCHKIDGGAGSHGLDMDEDMNIIHMFGFYPKNNT